MTVAPHLLAALLVVAADPEAGTKAFERGMARLQAGDARGAAEGFEGAVQLGYRPLISGYDLACARARAGDRDGAFAALQRIADAGYPGLQQLQGDADLASLHADPRWPKLVAAVHHNAAPCEDDAESRRFDFWIGSWEVQTVGGSPAGKSRVERVLGGCALLESWEGGLGGAGKSLNAYNGVKKQWQQFWVDSGGEIHEYAGAFAGKDLVLSGPGADRAGKSSHHRMTFTPLDGGRVRQRGELSDDGKIWTLEYELIYVPAK